MALKTVFVFSVIFLFTYCEAKPENCSEARCKLLPTGGGFAAEFRRKASQKGVRMVYLDLKIGNDSYHPLDLKDEFLSDRWVWASRISEPMLSLSFDYDILSLGLLTYQVRRIDVQLEDQPSGCLATLNSSCQNMVIGRMLLNETEYSSGSDEVSHDTDVVCVEVIEEKNDFFSGNFDGNVIYHCCEKRKQASDQTSSIECGLVAESSDWFKAFIGTLNFLTVVMMLYCPVFLLALPDGIFNLQRECEKEKRARQQHRQERGSGVDRRSTPRTSGYGPTDSTELDRLLPRGNGLIEDEIRYGSCSDSNSANTVEGNQQTDRPIICAGNDSVNQSGSTDEGNQQTDRPIISGNDSVNQSASTDEVYQQPDRPIICGNDSVNQSGSTDEGNQQIDRPIICGNDSVNQVVYLDDASPITCSALFGKYTQNYTDLIPFNIKLVFIFYCVIPIFVYIKLGLNYLVKREFVEELTSKQQAYLVGPTFSYLFDMKSFTSIATATCPLIMLLFSSPQDFLLTRKHVLGSSRCFLCSEYTSSIGEDMPKHLHKLKLKIYEWSCRLINVHKEGIEKSIKSCEDCYVAHIFKTDGCEVFLRNRFVTLVPLYRRLKRAVIVVWVLIRYSVITVALFSVILGVLYFFIFFPLCLGALGFVYSPFTSLLFVASRKLLQIMFLILIEFRTATGSFRLFLPIIAYQLQLIFLFFTNLLFLAVCYVGGLSCRFLVRMFGFIIMGLVLNAEIAGPFVTFVVVAATNMHLCYHNLQDRYKEVKQIISKQWQKHRNLLLNNNLSNSEEGTIPRDLFWHVCDDESKSKHKVLPVRSEIFQMFLIMALILIFLFLSLCSVIFLRNTYNVTAVASTIAIFVSGKIPGLFFKELTKKQKFTGRTKSDMIKEIDEAVKEYIKERNGIFLVICYALDLDLD